MGDLPEDSIRILAFCSPSQASGGKVLCPTYDPHTVFSSDTRAHRHKDQSLKPLVLSPSSHSLLMLKYHKSSNCTAG